MSVPEPARSELRRELHAASTARSNGDSDSSWHHLERAHILSQPWATQHIKVHAAMLANAVTGRDVREATGQLVRLLVAGPGSLTGRYPRGNTGRARISMFKPMPVPADLDQILTDTL